MLDDHLAQLYGVRTKALIQAVKRNAERFPPDFVSLFTDQEVKNVSAIRALAAPPAPGRKRPIGVVP